MLAVDSIFMMPQLGMLSTVMPEAASQVFKRDCLIKLGTAISPVGKGKEGQTAVTIQSSVISCQSSVGGGDPPPRTAEPPTTFDVPFGSVKVFPLGVGEKAEVTITPARGFDVGAGRGKPRTMEVEGGIVGLIVDARGRPFALPADDEKRIQKLEEWFEAFGLEVPKG